MCRNKDFSPVAYTRGQPPPLSILVCSTRCGLVDIGGYSGGGGLGRPSSQKCASHCRIATDTAPAWLVTSYPVLIDMIYKHSAVWDCAVAEAGELLSRWASTCFLALVSSKER
jgi:hypothetical protein